MSEHNLEAKSLRERTGKQQPDEQPDDLLKSPPSQGNGHVQDISGYIHHSFPEVSCQDTKHISKERHPDSKEAERETCILICRLK